MSKDSAEATACFLPDCRLIDASFPENAREYSHELYITRNYDPCWTFSLIMVRPCLF